MVAPGRSASTFAASVWLTSTLVCTRIRTGPASACWASASPSSFASESAGTSTGRTSVASIGPSCPGDPSLKTMTAAAPAAIAFRTFSAKKQPPRRMSAIAPVSKSSKSAESQPLVSEYASIASRGASTSPLPE